MLKVKDELSEGFTQNKTHPLLLLTLSLCIRCAQLFVTRGKLKDENLNISIDLVVVT